MFCPKCGTPIDAAVEVCPNCGTAIPRTTPTENTPVESVSPEQQVKSHDVPTPTPVYTLASTPAKKYAALRIVYFLLAALVLLLSFSAASSISSAGLNIASIESVGGKTLEEAYYQYSGELYLGYATIARTVGIFFAAVLAYLGIKG